MMSKKLSSATWNDKTELWNELIKITCVKYGSVEEAEDVMKDTLLQIERIHPNINVAEILHSYYLIAKGTIQGKIFRSLDFAQMNEFYSAYKEYRGGKLARINREGRLYLNTHVRKLESKDEFYPKEFKRATEIVENGGFYDAISAVGLFDWLYSKGSLKYTKEVANEWLKKGASMYKQRLSKKPIKKRMELLNAINPQELNKEAAIVRYAKTLMVNEFLKNGSL